MNIAEKQQYVADLIKAFGAGAEMDPATKVIIEQLVAATSELKKSQTTAQKLEAAFAEERSKAAKANGAVEALGNLLWRLKPSPQDEPAKAPPEPPPAS